jgi:hypothetical protein
MPICKATSVSFLLTGSGRDHSSLRLPKTARQYVND